MKGWIEHPELGRVIVTGSRATKHIIARWKGGQVCVSVPAHLSVNEIKQGLTELAPRLLAKKPSEQPDQRFRDGASLVLEGLTIEFRRISRASRISARPGLPVTIVDIGTLDVSHPDEASAVSRILKKIAAYFAEQLLLPRATEIAAELGLTPAGWKISRGMRTLGTCSSKRVISLSSNLVFLPLELRDYVVKHELAHLSEMNHSPRFHTLCNAYCGGKEKHLERKLRAFNWPVIR